MPECANCGAHVTADFVRVFKPSGAEELNGCPDCSSYAELTEGGPT